MKVKSIIQYGFSLTILSISVLAFAEKQQTPPLASVIVVESENNIYAPDLDIVKAEKDFTFDWTNYTTIAPNQDKIANIETVLKKTQDYSQLDAADKHALGKLLYKLGSYYIHAAQEPGLAITKMKLANSFLTDRQDIEWNYNNLAYAYAQQYAISGLPADKAKALYYTNKIISLNHHAKNKQVAFAYYINGLVSSSEKDYSQANSCYQQAFEIYEKVPYRKDAQYSILLNTYANNWLLQDAHVINAVDMLEHVNDYWRSKGKTTLNPYAADNLISLGQAYLKTENAPAARDALNKAVHIYNQVYGNNTPLLIKPYELLADTYQQLNDENQLDVYLQKADALDSASS